MARLRMEVLHWKQEEEVHIGKLNANYRTFELCGNPNII